LKGIVHKTRNFKHHKTVHCNGMQKIKIMTAQDLRYPGGGKFWSRFAFTA